VNNPISASDLLQSIQKLTSIVYLTRLDAWDEVKVRNYVTDAERELIRLKQSVMKLSTPDSPQTIN
jgi:hypothetical protein